MQVEKEEFRNKLQMFLKRDIEHEETTRENSTTLQAIQSDLIKSYGMVKEETENKLKISMKIFSRINVEEMTSAIFEFFLPKLVEIKPGNF